MVAFPLRRIAGEIPVSLGRLSNLKRLLLCINKFSGMCKAPSFTQPCDGKMRLANVYILLEIYS